MLIPFQFPTSVAGHFGDHCVGHAFDKKCCRCEVTKSWILKSKMPTCSHTRRKRFPGMWLLEVTLKSNVWPRWEEELFFPVARQHFNGVNCEPRQRYAFG
jgi:hypothetical protein